MPKKKTIKVSTTASYWLHPTVRRVLGKQDYVFTSNVAIVPVLERLIGSNVVIICISVAGGDLPRATVEAIIKEHQLARFEPADTEFTFEFTTFGDIVDIVGHNGLELDDQIKTAMGIYSDACNRYASDCAVFINRLRKKLPEGERYVACS